MRLLAITLFLLASLSSWALDLDSLKQAAQGADKGAIKANNLLYNQYINSNPKMALDFTLKALDLALIIEDKEGIAASYNNIGVFYKNHGVVDKAMNYHLQSMQLNKEINNAKGYAYSLNNIGTIYSMKDQPKKALEYFLQSYWLLDSLKDQKNMVGALNNLGNTYLAMGEDYRAIGFYKKAIKIFDKIDHSAFDPYSNIGNAYFQRGELDRAKKYYELSLQTSIDKKDIVGQAFAYHNLSTLLIDQGKKKEALELELKALENAQNVINKPLLNNRVLYDAYRNDILNETSSKKLADLEVTFHMLEKEKEIALIKKENEVNKLKVSNTKTIVIIAIMGAIILLGGIIIYISLKKGNKINLLDPRWKMKK